MKLKTALINTCVLALSSAIAMLSSEFVARRVLHAADYLSVEMVRHPVLGATPSNNTLAGGFDEWGFRNRRLPKKADIVAIGDSHTYGNAARMEDSWPYVVARETGRDVYNMGLGGYGPNQYFELFRTRALELKPKTVICGVYMGDDFENAFLITYGLEHWAYLRKLPPAEVNFDIWQEPPAESWHRQIRLWLSRHSVVYQLVVHGPLLGRLQGDLQIKNATRMSEDATSLNLPDKHILEAFLPKQILRRLDQQSPSVREGMRITFALLREMDAMSKQRNIDFIVVVIPTKEMVFSEYLEHNSQLPLNDVIDRLLINERAAREKVFGFLASSGITAIDALPRLKASTEQDLYTRTAGDMHPNKNGYRIIGEVVSEALDNMPGTSRKDSGQR